MAGDMLKCPECGHEDANLTALGVHFVEQHVYGPQPPMRWPSLPEWARPYRRAAQEEVARGRADWLADLPSHQGWRESVAVPPAESQLGPLLMAAAKARERRERSLGHVVLCVIAAAALLMVFAATP